MSIATTNRSVSLLWTNGTFYSKLPTQTDTKLWESCRADLGKLEWVGADRHASAVNSTENPGEPRIAVYIGKHKYSALLDTGASKSVMHPDIFTLIFVMLTVANGSPVTVDGRSVITLQIGDGPKVKHKFLVASLGPELIIGYDFFVKFDCVLDVKQNKLHICKNEIEEGKRIMVRAAEDVTLLPGYETIVCGELADKLQEKKTSRTMLLEAEGSLTEK
jgi:hypothetical protein